MGRLAEIARFLDDELRSADVPDYDGAKNGLQLENSGEVAKIAAAVDFSRATVERAVEARASLLIVHHGMFWGGAQRIIGATYERLRAAIAADLAVYSSHLPLDVHPDLGNNTLLARELGLTPATGFGRFQDIRVGCAGTTDVATTELLSRVRGFAARHASPVVATHFDDTTRRTKRWALVTGAGASSATVSEALASGVDTLIVGEGPHHTAIEARDHGLVIIYAGHYATETLGVQALAAKVAAQFDIPWEFLDLPTGL